MIKDVQAMAESVRHAFAEFERERDAAIAELSTRTNGREVCGIDEEGDIWAGLVKKVAVSPKGCLYVDLDCGIRILQIKASKIAEVE